MTLPPQVNAALVPLAQLEQHPENPRAITAEDLEHLKASLEQQPLMLWARPLIALPTGVVIAGNQRLAAARALGWTDLPVVTVDLDEKTAREWAIRDNNGFGDWDDTVAAYLRTMEDDGTDLAGLGFSGDELEKLLGTVTTLDPVTSGDTDPRAVGVDTLTQLGDKWVLGEHILVCGDSTNALAVELLLGEDRPDLIVTDPPYGVAYVGKTKDSLTIKNDAMGAEQTRDLFADTLSVSGLKPGGTFYATVPPGPMLRWFLEAVERGLGDDALRQILVWVKDQFVLGRSDYHYRHEAILYGWAPGAPHSFVDDRKQDSVWEIDRPRRSEEHPTMKPLELFERCMTNSSQPGEIVYDPFGGSGTTAIAAENLGRRARLMELDPAYCDVIVDRWQRHTDREAVRA